MFGADLRHIGESRNEQYHATNNRRYCLFFCVSAASASATRVGADLRRLDESRNICAPIAIRGSQTALLCSANPELRLNMRYICINQLFYQLLE